MGVRTATLAAMLGCSLAAGQEIPTEINRPVKSPGNAEWAPTADQARTRAAAQGKFVFVQFDRPGRECGHCRRMEALLYPAFDFEALLTSMVPVKLSLDSAEGKEMARQYGIEDVPAILVSTPEGRVVFLMQGFMTTQDFYQHIHKDIAAYRAFAERIEAQDIAHLSASEALETGNELHQRLDPGSALPRLRRAVSAPKATPAVRDAAREVLAAVEFDLGQIAVSRQTINRLIATTKDRDRRERAELFRAQIPLAENRPEEALALYKRFLKDHPKSQYLPRVNSILDRLAEGQRNP